MWLEADLGSREQGFQPYSQVPSERSWRGLLSRNKHRGMTPGVRRGCFDITRTIISIEAVEPGRKECHPTGSSK